MSKLLKKQIDILKNEIQDILHRINNEEVLEHIDEMNETKNRKIEELKVANDSYNALIIVEQEAHKENEWKKTCRSSDTLEFTKLKNKPNRNELLNTFKEKREKAREDFDNFKKIEEEYSLLDSIDIPGFLFFNNEIIKTYGLCPFIKIIPGFEDLRKEWLKNTTDEGKKYYDLYNIVINEFEYNSCIQKKTELEHFFEKLQDNMLTDSHKTLLSSSLEHLTDYLNCPVKTKKIKDKFKIIINNISILVIETGLLINEYWSLKYDNYIPINTLKDVLIHDKTLLFLTDNYKEKLEEYKKVKENIIQTRKYITNVKQHLKQELYEYLTNSKPTIEKQESKYANKKWSQLNLEEKHDRFESFSKFYVDRFLVSSGLILSEQKLDTIDKLYILLKESNIKFKDLKWNIKGGIIEKINKLKWDDTTKSLSMIKDVVKPNDEKLFPKRISSVKTIFNQESEKVINEEIVKFIIAKLGGKCIVDSKESKELLLENLKIKLRLKRITVNDKLQVYKKFDDIYTVISENHV
jgi:hypothetical protein